MHLIAHLEGYLVSVWHLGIGQDRHHPLLVVDRLRRRHRERQSLMFQKIAAKFLFWSHLLQHFEAFIVVFNGLFRRGYLSFFKGIIRAYHPTPIISTVSISCLGNIY